MIRVSTAFIFAIFVRKEYISICVCQGFVESSKAFNTLSKILLWIKPSYFQHGLSLSLENVCYSWCMHHSMKPGCLAQRPLRHKVNLPSCVVAQRPLCHKVNLPSGLVARRPLCHEVNLSSCVVAQQPLCHKVNLPSRVVAQRPLCHKVSLRGCEARRRPFILTCDIFGTGQTNILALCYWKNL